MSSAGKHWNGEYGYGAGRANPSVQFVTCPVCKAQPGHLCKGKNGVMLDRHYMRCVAYAEWRAKHDSRTSS